MKLITLEGSVENIIYKSDRNGYTVFEILSITDFSDNKVTCTAFSPNIEVGENVRLTGNFVMHPSYGSQFGVKTMERQAPNTIPGIIKYLSSSIKGIGERTAKRITDMFGSETFDIIENHPQMLVRIPGITGIRAEKISEMFKEQSPKRNEMMYLQQFGISLGAIEKIYKKYGGRSVDIVKTNPYLLADDIFGIGFKTADNIAAKAGIDPSSEFRVAAGIKYILNEAARHGHVYLEKPNLCRSVEQLLGIAGDMTESVLHNLQFARQVHQDARNGITAVYLSKYFHQESYVAKKLLDLKDGAKPLESCERDMDFSRLPQDMQPAECQKQAIRAALSCGVLVITGGPGTGKTTVINTLITLFEKRELKVELAAPTGRAAKRMEEAADREAKTIHRLLGINGIDEGGGIRIEKDESNPIEADVVIIDESSMVDITLMCYLLKALSVGTKLILVGDGDQLPSVGPGDVLKDIIKCGKIETARLTEIFRQSRESAIVMNAHRINNGEYPVLNEKGRGFYFVNCGNAANLQETLVSLITRRLPKYTGANPFTEIQVLTPMRKSGLGAERLNQVLQEALNPPSPSKREKEVGGNIFREGDKVMQIKNNYNLAWRVEGKGAEGVGVYNGDSGVILEIDENDELLRCMFEGKRIVDYNFSGLAELSLSYAVTIHKSQGSEYRVVVIPLLGGPPMLMTRNLLYTAVTRAKELVVIVGSREAMHSMVRNNREVQRFSALDVRISGQFE